MRKCYNVVWNGEAVTTDVPGKYAGSRNTKIFGRLDCPIGKTKMHAKNRVFFRDWEDAEEAGFRPCKVCRPDKPRLGEKISCFHPAFNVPHVALWETSPHPFPKKPSVRFYVALNWRESECLPQADLEEWLSYRVAIERAIKWGRRLGLPVIDRFWRADNHVICVPEGEQTPEQLCELQQVVNRKDVKNMSCVA